MGDTNVKIKLSADTKQVRSEIKLIDQELQELGGKSSTPTTGKKKPTDNQQSSSTNSNSTQNGKTKAQQEIDSKLNLNMYRELTLVRKELQKINKTGAFSGSGGSGGTTPPTTPNGNNNNTTTPSPSQQQPGGSGTKLTDVLGKLATAAIAMKAVSSAWNYVSAGAQSSATGESLAYQTYGSTLAYTDYYTAKKDAKGLGLPYGYDYNTVMNAGNTNMSKAGFTDLNNYNTDMNAILQTSKVTGIDANSLAEASGSASAMGFGGSGEQKKFTNMLAASIVDAQMTGREDEQLKVLENISDMLNQTMVTVKDTDVNNALSLYSTLANGNSSLKGQAGASMVDTINNAITNGSSTTDILLGWGTEYTGVAGKNQLQRLKEEGLSNPDTLAKVFNNFESFTGKGTDSEEFRSYLSSDWGLKQQEIDELLSHTDEIKTGNYKFNAQDEETSSDYLSTHQENYDNSDAATQEQNNIQKEDTKESAGEGLNTILNPFRKWYSGLGTGGRLAVDGAVGAGKIALTGAGLKGLSKLFKVGGTGTGLGGTGGGLSGLGTTISEGLSGAGSTLSSGLSTAGAYAYNGMSQATQFLAANPALTSWMGMYGPAIPDAINNTKQIISDQSDWNNLSDDEKAKQNFNGDALNTQAWTGSGGSGAGRDQNEYLTDLQANMSSGSTDWVDDWVDTYWREFDGQLEEASDNHMKEILDKAGVDLGQSSWNGDTSADTIKDAIKGMSKSQIDSVNSVYNKKNSDWLTWGFNHYDYAVDTQTAMSEGSDTQTKLKKSLIDTYNNYNNGETGGFQSVDDALQNTVWKSLGEEYGAGLSLGDSETMLKSILGDTYSREGGQWWRVGDSDSSAVDVMNAKYLSNDGALSEAVKNLVDSGAGSEETANNTTALEDNTDALKQLYEKNGLTYGAPYSQDYIDSKLSGNNSSSSSSTGTSTFSTPFTNSKTTGSMFNVFGNLFKSHAIGNDYVPYDDYTALLHKGEMVLTKSDADDYRQGKVGNNSSSSSSIDLNINLSGSISGMSKDNQNQIVAAVVSKIKSSDMQSMLSSSFTRLQNC